MRLDKRSKQNLNSNAHLAFIDVFVPAEVALDNQDNQTIAHFSPFKYTTNSLQLSPIGDGVIRKFPIIIRGHGTPWDLGNLYLMRKFTEMAKIEPPSVATIRAIAKHLVMYLRWIEHLQAEGKIVHELYFPREDERRVTWMYHRYLRRILRQHDQPISLSVAKARMQAVVGFYRGLLAWGLVEESVIENAPYESKLVGIALVSPLGLQFMRLVETTNLKINVPKRNSIGVIKDGGELRPLSEEEQTIFLEELQACGNRPFQLMCYVALYTGARIQTVCTLRVMDVYKLLKQTPKHGEVLLPIGAGTGVDTKNQKRYRLHIPVALASLLRDYIESDEYKKRRALSFYGDNEKNYVFLTSNGSCFYTSATEIADRQVGEFSKRISAKDRVTFTIQEGNALRNYLNRLILGIRRNHPDFNAFRFHDLRATYGMNFVRDADASGVRDVRAELKSRMGHTSFVTTQSYLKFDENNDSIKTVIAYHHDRINRDLTELQIWP